MGNGTDIWGAGDQFHYLYKSWTGDGTIIARVTALDNSMVTPELRSCSVREDRYQQRRSDDGVTPAANNNAAFGHRDSTGGGTSITSTGGLAPTLWLKVVRSGDSLAGYTAPDSSGSAGTWTLLGSQSLTMSSTILVGLATCSHTSSATTTATYDNVTVQ